MKSRSKTTTALDAAGIPPKRSVKPIISRDEISTEYDRPNVQKKSQSKLQQKLNKQPILLRPQLSGNTKVVDGRVSSSPQYIESISNHNPNRNPLMNGFQGQPVVNNNNNNGFFIDPRSRPVAVPVPQRPVSSVSGSSGLGSAGNLSTGGQELYIADCDDFVSDPAHIELQPSKPMWNQFGLHEGEDYEGEESLGRNFDEDVTWLMATTQVSLSPEPEIRNKDRVKSPTELVLKEIEQSFDKEASSGYMEETNPFSSTLRNSEPDPFATTINDGELRETGGFTPKGNNNRFGLTVDTSPDLDHQSFQSNPSSRKSRSRSNSPKSPKFYSWMGDRKTPRSRSTSGKRSPKRANQDPSLENQHKKPLKEEVHQHHEPLFVKVAHNKPTTAPQSHHQQQQQQTQSIAASKKSNSVKGLTKMVWDEGSVESPYLEHIRNPKAINELHKLHQEIFKKSYTKVPNSASSSPAVGVKPPPSSGNPTKAYAIINDPANRGLAPISKLPPRNLAPIQRNDRDRDSIAMEFLAISGKVKETNKKLPMRKELVPEDLYAQTQLYMKQLSPPRSAARVVNSQGKMNSLQGDNGDNGTLPNRMSTVPSSPKLPATAKGHRSSGGLNNIDHLVSEQVIPMTNIPIHPAMKQQLIHTRSSSPLNLEIEDELLNGEIDAIDMLSNTHIDPLYRILREEIEKIAQHSHTTNIIHSTMSPLPSPTMGDQQHGMTTTGGNLEDLFHPLTNNQEGLNLPANNRLRMRIHPSVNIVSSDIRVLSYFHSLPPGVWVTARIVYFLIMAYYETMILPIEHEEWRKLLNMDPIWQVLHKHYTQDRMNIHQITKTFSWPYLQELMKYPSLFVKLLDIIENGLQLENSSNPVLGNNGNGNGTPHGSSGSSAPSPRIQPPTATGTSANSNTWEAFHDNVKSSIEGHLLAKLSSMQNANNENHGNTSHLPHVNRNHLVHPGAGNGTNAQADAATVLTNNTLFNANSNSDLQAMLKVMETLPIWNVIDNESSQCFFFDTFPLQGFQPLREMVKSARAFLLSSSSVLFTNANYGTPLVPGSPLAVSAALTAWCKRVIAMLYITGTFRAKQMKNQGIMMLPRTRSPSPVGGTIAAVGTGLKESLETLSKSDSQIQLPPCVSFSVILDTTSLFFTEMMNANAAAEAAIAMGQQPGVGNSMITTVTSSIPQFLQTAYGLVKPSDVLEVLVSDKIESSIGLMNQPASHQHSQAAGRDMHRVKIELEQFLRHGSASPLHRIEILTAAATAAGLPAAPDAGGSANDATVATTPSFVEEANHILNQLHPILRHYFISKEVAATEKEEMKASSITSANSGVEQLEFLLTELRVGQKKPILPLIPAYSKEMVIATNTEVNPPEPITLADVVREQLNCSLALVSDNLSLIDQAELATSSSQKRARGFRYVVGVTDTQNSWSAFQLACRLAKDTDTITLIHIPTIDYHFSYPTTTSHKHRLSSNLTFKSNKILALPKPSLSFEEYQRLYDEAISRQSRIVNLYKSLGYNVLCQSVPSYVEITQRILENYSKMLRYYRQVVDVLGKAYDYNPMKCYQFFQFNEEVRHTSRLLLKTIQRHQPDFILLGADNFDVFNGLCHNFCESYWGFQSKCATEMVKSGPPYRNNDVLARQQQQQQMFRQQQGQVGQDGQRRGIPTSNVTVASGEAEIVGGSLGGEGAIILTNEAIVSTPTPSDLPGGDLDSYSQDAFESGAAIVAGGNMGRMISDSEKAVILSNRASFGIFDGDDMYDEEFEVGSQERLAKETVGSNSSKKTQPIIDDPIQVFAATANSQFGPSLMLPGANQPQHLQAMNDFELDSFIMEDNEEGENSLHASPHMLRQLHGQSGSIATASVVTNPTAVMNPNHNRQQGGGLNGGDPELATRQLMAHLQMYLQYAKYPANFADFMIHDAMNNVLLDAEKPMETDTLSYSFILANIPISSSTSNPTNKK